MNTSDIIVILAALTPIVGVIVTNFSNRKITKAKAIQDNIGGEKTAYDMYMDLLQKFNTLQQRIDGLQDKLDKRDSEVSDKDKLIDSLTKRVTTLENILKANGISF